MEKNNIPGSQPLPPMLEPVDHHHKWWITIAVIVVILIAVGVAALYLPGFDLGLGETTEEIAPGQFLTTTGEGEIVSDFPLELIIEEDVVVNNSYSVEYVDLGVMQPVVTYETDMNIADAVAQYNEHLKANGWGITQNAGDVTELDLNASMYAKTNTEDLNITFSLDISGGDMLTITLAYVNKETISE